VLWDGKPRCVADDGSDLVTRGESLLD